jgi:transposase
MYDRILKQVTNIELWQNKVIKQREAAYNLGISTRHFRRLIRRYEGFGAKGLEAKIRCSPAKKIPAALKEKVLGLIQTHFIDYGPTLLSEKLFEYHAIKVSKETARQWLIEIGTHKPKVKREKAVHERRARRSCRGELIQVDGSHHDWFEGRGPKCTLLVYIDDATSELLKIEFTHGETTNAYMKTFKEYILEHGIPQSMYTDKHNVFKVNPTDAKKKSGITQFGRALKELGCEPIFAHSPEAKGRVERVNRTLQDRLVKALRHHGISDIESGNTFLKAYIKAHNQQFSVPPKDKHNLHVALEANQRAKIDLIMSKQNYKKVFKDLTVKHGGKVYKIKTTKYKHQIRGRHVLLSEKPDGRVELFYQNELIAYELWSRSEFNTLVLNKKDVNHYLDRKKWLINKQEKALFHG